MGHIAGIEHLPVHERARVRTRVAHTLTELDAIHAQLERMWSTSHGDVDDSNFFQVPLWQLSHNSGAASIKGLDEERLRQYRQRTAADYFDRSLRARIRAIATRQARTIRPPGRTLTERPHIARGPSTRRQLTSSLSAGLSAA